MSAEEPGPGPPIPIALDLSTVPAGSWAEYDLTSGGGTPARMRVAVVAPNTVELSMKDGVLARRGGMVTQWLLNPDADRNALVRRFVVQVGANAPMNPPWGRRSSTGSRSWTRRPSSMTRR